MAGSFTSTGSYSNLTRLELEQLRRADFFSGGRALTVGDAGNVPGGVGPGSISAENYGTGPSIVLSEVYSISPPTNPGQGLLTITQLYPDASSSVSWVGPTLKSDGTTGKAWTSTSWKDDSANFTADGVQAGDILLVKTTPSPLVNSNTYAVAVVLSIAGGGTELNLGAINNPDGSSSSSLELDGGRLYNYAVIRPTVAQLFAVPGSGPLGREQTFFMVNPSSTLHAASAPTVDDINGDRIRDLVPPTFGLDSSVDRADAIYPSPAPLQSLDKLGYRVVLYRSLPNGSGPDLSSPISTLAPVIDPAVEAADQRMTIDYRAGVVRFSCAPSNIPNGVIQPDIKPQGGTGGVHPTTGRLQLYAVFWAFDKSLSEKTASGLYFPRDTEAASLQAGSIVFETANNRWRVNSSGVNSLSFVVHAPSTTENGGKAETTWGAATAGTPIRGFTWSYDLNKLYFSPIDPPTGSSTPVRLEIAPKEALSVGPGTPQVKQPGADFNAPINPSGGLSQIDGTLASAMVAAALGDYTTVHLRRGKYQLRETLLVPPGVMLEGEGYSTHLYPQATPSSNTRAVIKFGPNNRWGTYDFGANPSTSIITGTTLSTFLNPLQARIEGFDIVWNPVRRVWAYVYAESGTIAAAGPHSIFLYEVDLQGNVTFGPFTVATSLTLFTQFSTNSEQHTAGHYPRIDHHHHTDTYAIVWVELINSGGQDGPNVKVAALHWNGSTLVHQFSPVTANPSPGTFDFSDHPSVACDNSDDNSSFPIGVSMWGYTFGQVTSRFMFSKVVASTGAIATSATILNEGTFSIVSSTDISWTGTNGFVMVWSTRKHRLYYGTTGSVTLFSGVITDSNLSGGNWGTALGIEPGTRVVILGGYSDQGESGIVRNIPGGTGASVQYDGNVIGARFPSATASGTVKFVLAPQCRVRAMVFENSNATFSQVVQIAGPPTSVSLNRYHIAEREPDFVRIGRAGSQSRFVVVYQNFDVNGAMNRVSVNNWDNAIDNTTFVDGTNNLGSLNVTREHLSTSFVLLDVTSIGYTASALPTVSVAGPSRTDDFFLVTDANSIYHQARDHEVIRRSLGSAFMYQPFPNFAKNYRRWEWEISYRNHSQIIEPAIGRYPSMIPDVTWSGTDWTIVSPPPSPTIESDTGHVRNVSGTWYLSDGGFYFGTGVAQADGIFHRKNVSVGDVIHFPDAGTYVDITAGHSEHTVALSGDPGILSGTSNVKWVLCRTTISTGEAVGGLKNAGYRLTSDGKVLVSSSGHTMADDPLDSDTVAITPIPAHPLQTMNRSNHYWGNLNFGVATARHQFTGLNQMAYNDLLTESRFVADLCWKGVAVGAPKGCNEDSRTESPNVAIAWAENFYGVVDRLSMGTTVGPSQLGKSRTVKLFRQTFGPYRSGIRNLKVEGSQSGDNFSLKSKTRVFTRHGPPLVGNPFFATDGYRNIFVHWAAGNIFLSNNSGTIQSASCPDPRDPRHYVMYANAVVTDAIGRDPIRSRIGYSDRAPMTLSQAIGATDGDNYILATSLSKSIWTGKEFFTAIAEQDRIKVYYWGGDDHDKTTMLSADEMTGDTYWAIGNRLQLEISNAVASFYAGSGDPGLMAGYGGGSVNRSNAWPVDVVDFHMAWSGRVLAIVWCAGHAYLRGTDTQLGGAILGLTLIHPGHFSYAGLWQFPPPVVASFNTDINNNASPQAFNQNINATTFILDQEIGGGVLNLLGDTNMKGRIRDPKIVWDGTNFAVTYARYGGTTFNWNLRMVTFPEAGPATGFHLRRASQGVLQPIGTLSNDGMVVMRMDGYNPNGLQYVNTFAPAVGDLVQITRGGTTGNNIQGWFTVQSIDYRSGRAWLGIDMLAYGGANGEAIYGAIWSQGVSNYTAIQALGQGTISSVDGWARRTTSGPAIAPSYITTPFASTGTTSHTKCFGLFYKEEDDTYVVFTTNGNVGLYAIELGKSSRYMKEVVISATGAWHVDVGYNGQDFFVLAHDGSYAPPNGTYFYAVLSKDLTVKKSLTAFENQGLLFGNGPMQVPGPGYAPPTNSNYPFRRPWGAAVQWNDRLSRWVVSLSTCAIDSDFIDATGLHVFQLAKTWDGQRAGIPVTSISGRIATAGSTAYNGYRNTGHRFYIVQQQQISSIGSPPSDYLNIQSNVTDTGYSTSGPPYNGAITFAPTGNNTSYRGGATITSGPNSWLGVAAGDTAHFLDSVVFSSQFRRMAQAGSRDGNSNDHIYVEGALIPTIPAGFGIIGTVIRSTPIGMVHLLENTSATTSKIDIASTESNFAGVVGSYTSSNAIWAPMAREDVFMYTFGYDGTPIAIEDADDLTMENVEIGGYTDITERMRNFSRPFYKVGGLTSGYSSDNLSAGSSAAAWSARPHAYPVYPTPLGRTDGIRMSNVRSKAGAKYANAKGPLMPDRDREDIGIRNRRG